jgi:SPP1 gp7 family putative phage head morphogenesis protein
MAAYDDVIDMSTTHQVYVEFYKNQILKELKKELVSLEKKIKADLIDIEPGLSGVYTKTLKSVKDSIDKFDTAVYKYLFKELSAFLKTEIDFYKNQLDYLIDDFKLGKKSKKPVDAEKKLLKGKMILASGAVFSLAEQIDLFLDDNRKRLLNNLESAKMLDLDSKDLVNQVSGNNGHFHITLNRMAAMSSTAVAFASSVARTELYDFNQDRITGYQWISVIDSKTTEFCRWADGRTYYYKDGSGTLGGPYEPPVHNRCRSATVPLLKGFDYGDKLPRKTTYYQWLDKQPAGVQKDVLGPVRYNLWKTQGVTPAKFYNRNGVYLTLKQLEAKNVEIPKNFIKYVKG